jgi:hypothetical protein
MTVDETVSIRVDDTKLFMAFAVSDYMYMYIQRLLTILLCPNTGNWLHNITHGFPAEAYGLVSRGSSTQQWLCIYQTHRIIFACNSEHMATLSLSGPLHYAWQILCNQQVLIDRWIPISALMQRYYKWWERNHVPSDLQHMPVMVLEEISIRRCSSFFHFDESVLTNDTAQHTSPFLES